MYYQIPLPITCAFCGGLAGLVGGGCNQLFPVWIGAATGFPLGCAISIFLMCQPEEPVQVETPQAPVIIENVYIAHVSGEPKLPIAKVVEN